MEFRLVQIVRNMMIMSIINAGKNVKENTLKYVFIVFGLIIILLFIFMYQKPKGYIYLIPNNYEGKLEIVFNVKNEKPLKKEHGYFVVQFSKNGIVKTSSRIKTGKLEDKYFYFSKNKGIVQIFPEKNIIITGGYIIEGNNSIKSVFWIKKVNK
jgi:flagellar biosynthesis protein FliQ